MTPFISSSKMLGSRFAKRTLARNGAVLISSSNIHTTSSRTRTTFEHASRRSQFGLLNAFDIQRQSRAVSTLSPWCGRQTAHIRGSSPSPKVIQGGSPRTSSSSSSSSGAAEESKKKEEVEEKKEEQKVSSSEKKSENAGEEIILSPMQKKFKYACQEALPFVGFGFMDNMIMIFAADRIEACFGEYVHYTLVAAAFGQCCSDVGGTFFGQGVDWLVAQMGCRNIEVSPTEASEPAYRIIRVWGAAIGVAFGCVMGMFPLLFLDTGRPERLKKQKELRSVFEAVAEEGQRSLNVERCNLYVVSKDTEQLEKGIQTYSLARQWTPSRAQVEECKRQAQVKFDTDGKTPLYSVNKLASALNKSKSGIVTLKKRIKGADEIVLELDDDADRLVREEEVAAELGKLLAGGSRQVQKKTVATRGTKGYVLKENPEILVLEDVYMDQRFAATRKFSTRQPSQQAEKQADIWRAKSVMIVPVFAPDTKEPVGVIEMVNKIDKNGKTKHFTKGDERLGILLAHHTSIFLDQCGDDLYDILDGMVLDEDHLHNGKSMSDK